MRAFRKTIAPVWWPVHVTEAVDGGETETFEFQARLMPFKTSDLKDMRVIASDIIAIIREHVVDWSGVIDPETKESIPFSDERLSEAMDQSPELLRGLEIALMEVSSGGGERKNSKPSRAQ